LRYKPKFGKGGEVGCSLKDFQKIYRDDPFYSWFGLDNPLVYAAHKAAGGITSIYRQIGIGCEQLFRLILQDVLGLSEDACKWSYDVLRADNRTRNLSLDGCIPVQNISDKNAKKRIKKWINESSRILEIVPSVAASIGGIVFEVRQGYKSKDSKRQNADIANAAAAYTKGYLPCAFIFSTQIDQDILLRYRAEKWLVLIGLTGSSSPFVSSYAFMKEIVGYDLAAFFQRNSLPLRKEIDQVFKVLLAPE
jgi:hypothetical protein